MNTKRPEDPRYRLTYLLIGMRLLVVSAALVAGYCFYAPDNPFYWIIAVFYGITFVHLFLLVSNLHWVFISEIQLVVDVVLTTFLVHYTGGIDSAFVFFYPLCIVAASVLGTTGGFSQSLATASALFFGLLVLLEYTGVLDTFAGRHSSYEKGPWLVAFLYFFRVFIFGLVSVVGSFLMRRIKFERAQARRAEDLSSHVLDRMSHGVITVGDRDKIVFANERALEILGCALEGLVGKNWRGVFHDSVICDPGQEPFFSVSSGNRNEMHLAISCPDGSEKVIGLHFSHQYDEGGKIIHKVILFQDLTEMRRMEKKLKAAEKWALLGEVAAGIVHEIRNPLGAIRGSIEVLKEHKVFEGKDAALLDIVLQESDRLNNILEDYLIYTGKKSTEQKKEWDLRVIVDQVLRMVQAHPRLRKDIRLHWDCPKDIAGSVFVDHQQIRQVLLNMIQNALDAMSRGGDLMLRLEESGSQETTDFVSGRQDEEKIVSLGRWIRLDIRDTGQGMTPEILDRLYEPFFSTKDEGHGIGLALCRRIIEAHQGFLKVQSQLGKGTTFSIYLPVLPQASSAKRYGKTSEQSHG